MKNIGSPFDGINKFTNSIIDKIKNASKKDILATVFGIKLLKSVYKSIKKMASTASKKRAEEKTDDKKQDVKSKKVKIPEASKEEQLKFAKKAKIKTAKALIEKEESIANHKEVYETPTIGKSDKKLADVKFSPDQDYGDHTDSVEQFKDFIKFAEDNKYNLRSNFHNSYKIENGKIKFLNERAQTAYAKFLAKKTIPRFKDVDPEDIVFLSRRGIYQSTAFLSDLDEEAGGSFREGSFIQDDSISGRVFTEKELIETLKKMYVPSSSYPGPTVSALTTSQYDTLSKQDKNLEKHHQQNVPFSILGGTYNRVFIIHPESAYLIKRLIK